MARGGRRLCLHHSPFPLLTVAHRRCTNRLEDFRFEGIALVKTIGDFRWVQCSIDSASLKQRNGEPNPTLGTNLFRGLQFSSSASARV